ncbi:MAG: signal peptidase I [Armatimonadota bacterium]
MNFLPRVIIATIVLASLTGCGPPNYVMMSDDMAPTIERGDIIAIDASVHDEAAPERGEIVAYHAPDDRDRKMLIGRVVAVGGDEIRVKGGTLTLNAEPVEEPFAAGEMGYEVPRMTLPEDHLFILGDNRNEARDSHVFGPVPAEAIVGRITDVQKPPGQDPPIASRTVRSMGCILRLSAPQQRSARNPDSGRPRPESRLRPTSEAETASRRGAWTPDSGRDFPGKR